MTAKLQQNEGGKVFVVLPSKVLTKLGWCKGTPIKFEVGYDLKNSPSALIVREK